MLYALYVFFEFERRAPFEKARLEERRFILRLRIMYSFGDLKREGLKAPPLDNPPPALRQVYFFGAVFRSSI